MNEYHTPPTTYFSQVERPRCPKCHEPRMHHTKTEAGPPDFEYRTFECRKCGRVHTMILSSDPLELNLRGWLEPSAPD